MTVLIARRSTTATMAMACALVLAGTIGNLIDRVVRGRVIDFIYFHHDAFRYPVFNLADAAITTGVAMILLFSWLHERAAKHVSPPPLPDRFDGRARTAAKVSATRALPRAADHLTFGACTASARSNANL